ncbi:hypothetical protein MEZE111188_05225 [Mesobacillus zeae]
MTVFYIVIFYKEPWFVIFQYKTAFSEISPKIRVKKLGDTI